MLTNLKAKLQSKLHSDAHFAELVKGSGIAFALRIFGIICGYIFTMLVTRTLGAEAWGIFSLCLVVLQISSVIGRLGMDTALLRFTAEYTAKGEINTLREIYKKALNLVIPFSIFVSVSVYFLSPILSTKIFHKPYLTSYFKIISFTIVPFVLLWIHSESIRGLKKIKVYMLLQQAGIFCIALLLFLIELSFVKTKFLPIVSYTISIIVISIISIYLWRKYLIRITSTISYSSTTYKSSKTSYQSILSVSMPMFFSSSLTFIMSWTDTIMLGMFKSVQEVGVYNVILKIALPFSLIWISINTIMAPKCGYMISVNRKNKLKEIIILSSNMLTCFSLFFLLFNLLLGKYILSLFGSEFVVGYIALIIISLGYFMKNIFGLTIDLMNMAGLERYLFIVSFLGMVMNIIMNYIFIPVWGMNGAAIATASSLSLSAILRYLIIKYKLNISTLPNFKSLKLEG